VPSILAIVSKSQFDQQTKGKGPAPGVVLGIDRYTTRTRGSSRCAAVAACSS
jgi:hypothetical protein